MKSNFFAFTSVAVLITILVPANVDAQTRQPRSQTDRSGLGTLFCENIDTARTTVLSKVAERAGKAHGRQGTQAANFEAEKTDRINKLELIREDKDDSREERYESMRNKAATGEQQLAVEEFIKTVEGLVEKRREAIDAAIATFESGVAALKDERDALTKDLQTEIEATFNEIFDDAEAACKDGKSPEEVRANIKAAMEALRKEHQVHRETYSFRQEFEALRTERKLDFDLAKEDFQKGLTQAKAILKEAFGS